MQREWICIWQVHVVYMEARWTELTNQCVQKRSENPNENKTGKYHKLFKKRLKESIFLKIES